mmetsp:Transcript_84746/g.168307  ORF Transcript_84746/g.168307 Transcript_84746/m.168307 type:complete len:496 (+) Transcript_84746:49-1536(+)
MNDVSAGSKGKGEPLLRLYKGMDIKKWYEGVITPDFNILAATRIQCRSIDNEDQYLSPMPRLAQARQIMRENSRKIDPDSPTDSATRPLFSRWSESMQPGNPWTCSLALTATALGAGALGMPFAFSLTGIVLGLLTLTLAGMVTALSLQILMVAARYTGVKSYAAVLELSLGSSLASVVLDIMVLLNGFGSMTCILIFEGDFLPSIFAAPLGMQGYGLSLHRNVAVIVLALLVWPLTLPSDPSALRYVAATVPAALIVTIGIVLWDAPELYQAAEERGDSIVLWNPNLRSWLQAAAIMVNAFANIQNAVPTANELERPTVKRIIKATVNGQFLIWLLLGSLGIGGYLSWGSATKGDFLLNYPQDRPEIWTCRLMLAIIVYCVLPLATLPTAKSVAQILLSLVGSRRHVSGTLHAVCATIVLALCTATALKVSDVASVLGVVGGLLASSLLFWFPAIIFWKLLWPMQPKMFRWPVLLLLLLLGTSCWASVAAGFVE